MYKILVRFEAFVYDSIILAVLLLTCIAHTIGIRGPVRRREAPSWPIAE